MNYVGLCHTSFSGFPVNLLSQNTSMSQDSFDFDAAPAPPVVAHLPSIPKLGLASPALSKHKRAGSLKHTPQNATAFEFGFGTSTDFDFPSASTGNAATVDFDDDPFAVPAPVVSTNSSAVVAQLAQFSDFDSDPFGETPVSAAAANSDAFEFSDPFASGNAAAAANFDADFADPFADSASVPSEASKAVEIASAESEPAQDPFAEPEPTPVAHPELVPAVSESAQAATEPAQAAIAAEPAQDAVVDDPFAAAPAPVAESVNDPFDEPAPEVHVDDPFAAAPEPVSEPTQDPFAEPAEVAFPESAQDPAPVQADVVVPAAEFAPDAAEVVVDASPEIPAAEPSAAEPEIAIVQSVDNIHTASVDTAAEKVAEVSAPEVVATPAVQTDISDSVVAAETDVVAKQIADLNVALAESHDVIANADPQSLTTSLHALTDVVQILAQPFNEQLNSQLSDARTNNIELTQLLHSAQSQLADTQAERDELLAKLSQAEALLQTSLASASQQNDLAVELEQSKAEHARLFAEIVSVKSQHATLAVDHQRQRDEMDALQSECTESRSKIADLNAEVDSKSAQIAAVETQFQADIAKLRGELSELKEKFTDEHIRHTQAQVQKQFLKNECNKLQNQTQTLQSNLEQLQQTLTQAIQQQSDAVAAHNEAEIKLAERTRVAQETKEKLTQELEARSEQIEALQEQIDSDVAVREALTREVAQLTTALNAGHAELQEARTAAAAANAEHEASLASINKQLEESNSAAHLASVEFENQITAANSKATDAEERAQSLSRQLQDVLDEKHSLGEELNSLQHQLQIKTDELSAAAAQTVSVSAQPADSAQVSDDSAIRKLQSQHEEAMHALRAQARHHASEQQKLMQQRVETITKQLESDKQTELNSLRQQFQAQTERQKALYTQLQQQLKDSQNASGSSKTKVSELESQIGQLQAELRQLRGTIDSKENEIAQVRAESAKELKRMKRDLSKTESLKSKLDEAEANVHKMQQENEERAAKEVADARKKKSMMAFLECPEDPPSTGHVLNVQTTFGSEFKTQWCRSFQGAAFAPIKGANLPSYLVSVDDVGSVLRAECTNDHGDKVFCDTQGLIVCSAELLTAIEANMKKSEVLFKVNTVPAPPKAVDKHVLLNHDKIKIREGDKTKIKEEYSEHVRCLLHPTQHEVVTVFVTDKLFFTYAAISSFERDVLAAMVRLYSFAKNFNDPNITVTFSLRHCNEVKSTAMQNPIEAALEKKFDITEESHGAHTPTAPVASHQDDDEVSTAAEHVIHPVATPAAAAVAEPSHSTAPEEIKYDEDGYIIRSEQAAPEKPARKALPPISSGNEADDTVSELGGPSEEQGDAPPQPVMVLRIRAASDVSGPSANDLRRHSIMRPPPSSSGAKSAGRRASLMPTADHALARVSPAASPVIAPPQPRTVPTEMSLTAPHAEPHSVSPRKHTPQPESVASAPAPAPAPVPVSVPVTVHLTAPATASTSRGPSPSRSCAETDSRMAIELTFQETMQSQQDSGRVVDFSTQGELLLRVTPTPTENDLLFRVRIPGFASSAVTDLLLNSKIIRESPSTPGQYVIKVPKGTAQLALARYKVDSKTSKPPLLLLPQWSHASGNMSKLVARYKVNHRYISPQTEISMLAQVDPPGSVTTCINHEPANTMKYAAAKQKCLWTLPLAQADGAISVTLQTSAPIQPHPLLVNFVQDNSTLLLSGLDADGDADAAVNAAANCYLQKVVKRIRAGVYSAQ